MVIVEASCVIVASWPSPPMPPCGALASGTSVHLPAKFGGACAAAMVIDAATASTVNTRVMKPAPLALSARAPGPGRPRALRHIERGEDADRLHAFDQPFAFLFECVELVAEVGHVFFVDDHFSPVLDKQISRLRTDVAKE